MQWGGKVHLTYLRTSQSRVLLEKPTGSHLFMKFLAEVHYHFTSAHHLSLSWTRSLLSMSSHPTSWRSILILSSHLCLGLPCHLFPSGFATKTLYTLLLSPIPAACLIHLILLNLITQIIFVGEYRSFSSTLYSFLHYPVTSSLLGPYIFFNTLFWNTLSLHFSLTVSDQVSNPYKTTAKIMVIYFSIFIFLCSKL